MFAGTLIISVSGRPGKPEPLIAHKQIAMAEEAKPGGGTSLIAEGTKVVETSVMKDLLGPSAKILGEYLGEHTWEFVDKWREQRRKNLSDHEHNVANVTGEPVDIFGKPESGRAIERWLTVAIDVPIEDAERSAVYEAVLAEILSSRGSDFQDVADRLSASGMRPLPNAPSERRILPGPDDLETLRSCGSLASPAGLTSRALKDRGVYARDACKRFVWRYALQTGLHPLRHQPGRSR